MHIRLATAADSPAIIALLDRVFREYGDRVNLAGAEADLLDLNKHYFSKGGAFWVLADTENVWGSHAFLPLSDRPGVCVFRRLYLDASLRGTEWGRSLMRHTLDWARSQGCSRVEFWSDTRFERAHRFFAKFGFVRSGERREMQDGAAPYSEYFYYLDLA